MRTTLIAALALLLAACGIYEPTGVRGFNDTMDTALDALRVGQVLCDSPTLVVGESTQCYALNTRGTRLSVEGVGVVIWYTDSPATLAIDLAGVATAEVPGTARVYAEGARGSSAWYEVVIE